MARRSPEEDNFASPLNTLTQRLVHTSTKNIKGRVLRAGTALGVARLLSRGVDLVRMLTIARWLGPSEMGVYAVAALMLTALEQFSETGLRPALIQRSGDISRYVTPVRTVQVVRGFFLGLMVFITAPWVSSFFHSPESLDMLRVIAIVPVIQGIEPLFVTLAQRELQFVPTIVIQTVASFVSLAVGLAVAYFRPDAWALVLSTLSGVIIATAGAYILSDRQTWRLSLNWAPLKDLRGFGFWIFAASILSYAFSRGGDWMIGRLLDVRELALYQMAFLICTTGIREMGLIFSQLSFPVFSRLQHDKILLQSAYEKSFGLISIVTFFAAGLVYVSSYDFYRLALGDRWIAAIPLVPWLTVWGICSTFAGVANGIFYALGRPKLWAQTFFAMTILLAMGLYPMVRWQGALGVAMCIAGIGVSIQLVRYLIIARLLLFPFSKVFLPMLVPTMSCIFAATLTSWFRSLLPMISPKAGLIATGFSLLIVYMLFLGLGRSWLQPSFRELSQYARNVFRRPITT